MGVKLIDDVTFSSASHFLSRVNVWVRECVWMWL